MPGIIGERLKIHILANNYLPLTSYQPFSISFWSAIFMMTAATAAFIASIKFGYRMKVLKFLPYYTMASLLQCSIGFYYLYILRNRDLRWVEAVDISENIFVLLEFILLNIFLIRSIVSKPKKKITGVIASIFLLFLLIAWIRPYGPMHHIGFLYSFPNLYAWGSLFIVIPCLFYFYELFKFRHIANLESDPNFWVVVGIFFYNSCSIPLFLLFPIIRFKIESFAQLFNSLNYILYGIFFLLLARASYLARPNSRIKL
jgi:hypothetical protein